MGKLIIMATILAILVSAATAITMQQGIQNIDRQVAPALEKPKQQTHNSTGESASETGIQATGMAQEDTSGDSYYNISGLRIRKLVQEINQGNETAKDELRQLLKERARRVNEAYMWAVQFVTGNYSGFVERMMGSPSFARAVGNYSWELVRSNLTGAPMIGIFHNPYTGEIIGYLLNIYVYNETGHLVKILEVQTDLNLNPILVKERPPIIISTHPLKIAEP